MSPRPCPCSCGRMLPDTEFDLADTGVQVAWATRLLDISTQYQPARHPLAETGDQWARLFLLAGHGDPHTTLEVPDDDRVEGWLDAVQAIAKEHRLDVIRSRYSPARSPHTQAVTVPDIPVEADSMFSAGNLIQTRWMHVGSAEDTSPTPVPGTDVPDPEVVGPESLGEFLSSDVSLDGFKALLANMDSSQKLRMFGIAGAVFLVFLVFLIL